MKFRFQKLTDQLSEGNNLAYSETEKRINPLASHCRRYSMCSI